MSDATNALTIFVSDTILVSEALVVEIVFARLITTGFAKRHGDIPIVSVQEYRDLLRDEKSTDEQIRIRLEYLEMLCRSIIKSEVKMYGKSYVYGRR
ncbi:MAG: hypothetical protein WAZ27_03635 [Minisyncoccia bacterium]